MYFSFFTYLENYSFIHRSLFSFLAPPLYSIVFLSASLLTRASHSDTEVIVCYTYTNNDARRVVHCICSLLPSLLPAVVELSSERQQREEKLVCSFVNYCHILLGVETLEKNLTISSWNCLSQSRPVLLTCTSHQRKDSETASRLPAVAASESVNIWWCCSCGSVPFMLKVFSDVSLCLFFHVNFRAIHSRS